MDLLIDMLHGLPIDPIYQCPTPTSELDLLEYDVKYNIGTSHIVCAAPLSRGGSGGVVKS